MSFCNIFKFLCCSASFGPITTYSKEYPSEKMCWTMHLEENSIKASREHSLNTK